MEKLMASTEQERAYRQGYDQGWKAAMAHRPMTKPRRVSAAFAEGLRRRADWFRYRSDLALQAGNEERAVVLDAWAQDELKRLRELGIDGA